jgi:RNA polymerase sigma-70 factor, ECF subfamily
VASFRVDEVLPQVYDELRELAERHMRAERANHTLQPSALVHEAYMRLRKSDGDFVNRAHFFAAASEAIRRILIEHARRFRAVKRGGPSGTPGGRPSGGCVALEDSLGLVAPSSASDPQIDVLEMGDALAELERMDPRLGRVVTLRFFGGLSVDEVAASLGLSKRTVESDWTIAKAWLRRKLAGDASAAQGDSA